MSNCIVIESDDPAETAISVAAVARLLSKIEPETLKEEIEIVSELMAAIADATDDIASHLCAAQRRERAKDQPDFITLPEGATTAFVQ